MAEGLYALIRGAIIHEHDGEVCRGNAEPYGLNAPLDEVEVVVDGYDERNRTSIRVLLSLGLVKSGLLLLIVS